MMEGERNQILKRGKHHKKRATHGEGTNRRSYLPEKEEKGKASFTASLCKSVENLLLGTPLLGDEGGRDNSNPRKGLLYFGEGKGGQIYTSPELEGGGERLPSTRFQEGGGEVNDLYLLSRMGRRGGGRGGSVLLSKTKGGGRDSNYKIANHYFLQ